MYDFYDLAYPGHRPVHLCRAELIGRSGVWVIIRPDRNGLNPDAEVAYQPAPHHRGCFDVNTPMYTVYKSLHQDDDPVNEVFEDTDPVGSGRRGLKRRPVM